MPHMIVVHIEMKKDGRWEHISTTCLGAGDQVLRKILTGQDPKGPALGLNTLPGDVSVPTRVDMDLYKADGTVADLAVIPGGAGLTEAQALYRDRIPGMSWRDASLEESVFGCYVGGEPLAKHRGYDDVRAIAWLVP